MPSPSGPTPSSSLLSVRSTLVLLIGALIGVLVGGLTHLDGNSPAASVLAGLLVAGASIPVLHNLVG
ncbi:hypothetical protein [Streptomyces sp. NPDC050704]|uniref:hypothetical protein n=1 Tax=Streptomyces sp. NPDC050704 TaxID=3157219 RepID=UPI0034446379